MTQGRRETASRRSRSASGGERGAADTAGDRYRAGARRTTAEPLTASWEPELPKRERPRGVLRTYGWRVYALPVMLAVTGLVLVQTAGEKSTQVTADAASTANQLAADAGAPVVTEQRATPVDLNIPTAELPNGGAFTQAGAGTWHGVPGSGPKVGTGQKFYTYTVEVEDGIDLSALGGDAAFATLVDSTLAEPRGWTSLGQIAVQRVEPDFPNPSFRISLTTPDTAHRPDMCGHSIPYEASCYLGGTQKRVMINLARWVRGAVAFGGDMTSYRQYAINHEVGHAFRNGHVGCPEAGALAPVMMQQSFGVANDYVAQLNQAVNLHEVKADGLVCKPNAWPNPQARPAG
ncbi:DUF3152 domain-containing protein [Actinokineospora iranica]|uniref:DUF3152 domain-containing protein n=1 Tax=Actinokineospora iranica TaxID=1271860 RepID=A0A1G6R4H0_9PSEU|nr:DUF3152 domain-containing protein [Actinokineospora iranica]SDC98897.1 Protein of unknown function [Actinokineospora iranica]